jgi:hypothetical protein
LKKVRRGGDDSNLNNMASEINLEKEKKSNDNAFKNTLNKLGLMTG